MTRRRSGEDQIIRVLKEVRLGHTGGGCAASTASATRPSINWRSKYGGLEVSDAGRLMALEAENA